MSHRDIVFWMEMASKGMHRISGYLRELSKQKPRYKPAYYTVNRCLNELDAALREMRDAEEIEPAPRSTP